MGRAPCCDKTNVKKGPWSPEEDAKLKEYIDKYGTGGNWIALPQKMGLKRCGKSCRLRWLNYLRPNIRHGGFSEEEDNIILSLYISIGSRWSIIAAQLPGRTDNDIKNYWNTRLKKKLLGRQKQMIRRDSIGDSIESSKNSLMLSNSALERLRLHMQIQNLQNPFSTFYNNPLLWPKLHPLQEKMIQHSLQPSDENPNIVALLQNPPIGNGTELVSEKSFPRTEVDHKVGNQIDGSLNANRIPSSYDAYSLMGSNLISPKSGGMELCVRPVPSFHTDLASFLGNRNLFASTDYQTCNFDGLRDMSGSNERFAWWFNEFEPKSASTSSWDSTTVLDQTYGMFQDYAQLGYNNM